jgi:hypothetical protein
VARDRAGGGWDSLLFIAACHVADIGVTVRLVARSIRSG